MTREEKERLLAEIENQYKWLMTKSPTIYMIDIAFDAIRKAVRDEASKEQLEPRWIPVSEKLPNDRDWYLGIFKEADTGWINPLPFICVYMGLETMATTKEHWILRGFTDRDVRDCDYYFNLECVAWMPLPEAESEDKE
ncbi:DUF551 domain-containing protein [Butyrivibrio sp. INlla21]|uniref:DUF551 domain-containing protein n=1 Tax=Butyrivibrio sp. INlla21 TaxID=1520811 RepID=UPI0008E4C3C7|nr:DUF551 domain-containing protein [Butyrivibrio sp. INlla21]SFU57235.1 Protein of unknown function [Butyrivibrio sp. INlla21]